MARSKAQPFTADELQAIDDRLRKHESVASILKDYCRSKTAFTSRLTASGYEPFRGLRPIVPVDMGKGESN